MRLKSDFALWFVGGSSQIAETLRLLQDALDITPSMPVAPLYQKCLDLDQNQDTASAAG